MHRSTHAACAAFQGVDHSDQSQTRRHRDGQRNRGRLIPGLKDVVVKALTPPVGKLSGATMAKEILRLPSISLIPV